VWIIAATNQDLGRMVEEKKFRADLYYRLNVFPISLPPLREWRGDVRLLAEHFVRKFSEQQGKVIDAIPEEVMMALERHYWPGNIRELQNVIERGVIMTTGPVLSYRTTDRLGAAVAEVSRLIGITTLAEAERAHITATLRATKWVIGGAHGAAVHLGLPRTTLLSRMHRLGISSQPSQGWTRKRGRGVVPLMESFPRLSETIPALRRWWKRWQAKTDDHGNPAITFVLGNAGDGDGGVGPDGHARTFGLFHSHSAAHQSRTRHHHAERARGATAKPLPRQCSRQV
jgi:hypothetical protein